jgi:hypothetical protein
MTELSQLCDILGDICKETHINDDRKTAQDKLVSILSALSGDCLDSHEASKVSLDHLWSLPSLHVNAQCNFCAGLL